jgi:hypothetical protein
MEIIEDSPPPVVHTEHVDLRVAGMAQPQVADMQVADMRGRPAASPAIVEQPLTGAQQGTEPTPATGDSPAATELSPDADQAHRGRVVSAAAAAGRRADSLRMEATAVRAADTLAADMPEAVEGTVAVEVTVVAGANCSE